jgi:hypothetical protein
MDDTLMLIDKKGQSAFGGNGQYTIFNGLNRICDLNALVSLVDRINR